MIFLRVEWYTVGKFFHPGGAVDVLFLHVSVLYREHFAFFSFIIFIASKSKTKRKRNTILYSLGIAIISLIVGIANGIPESISTLAEGGGSSPTEAAQNKGPVIDAAEFALITPEDLVSRLGNPESTETGNFKSPKVSYATTWYYYNSGVLEFMVIDKKVVRITYNGKVSDYKTEGDLFKLFNITPGSKIKAMTTVNGVKYSNPSDNIQDLWVATTTDGTATYKLTFDMKYFE